jgi:hypothetical protein
VTPRRSLSSIAALFGAFCLASAPAQGAPDGGPARATPDGSPARGTPEGGPARARDTSEDARRALPEDPSDLYRAAREAEASARPKHAVRSYAALVERHPTSRLAARAERRLVWLRARSEGDYEPLAALLEMRARSPSERTVRAMKRFLRRVAAFPPGLVRREGYLLAAEELARAGETQAAVDAYRALLDDPELEPDLRRSVASELATLLDAAGRSQASAEVIDRFELEGSSTAKAIRARRGRRRLRIVAWCLLAAFALVWMGTGGPRGLRLRELRRAFRPGRLLLAGWVLGVPVVLAAAYSHEAVDTFAALSSVAAAVLLLTAIGARGAGASRRRRATLAVAAAVAQLAAAYLVLDRAGLLLSVG